MGCASSSPLVNGGGPGGLVDSAKTAATDVMSSGENALHELGENITESVGQIKDTMVETVNGMTNSIGDVINDGMTKIPLKESIESTNHLLDENMENLKNEMLSKGQSIGDEADKIADELIKDTEDVIRDAETGIVDLKNEAVESLESMKDQAMDKLSLNSPSHSIETIQQNINNNSEPEIEKIMNVDDNPFSPQATVEELDNLNGEQETPPENSENSSEEPKVEEEPPAEETQIKKSEDDLVVEDIKDESS